MRTKICALFLVLVVFHATSALAQTAAKNSSNLQDDINYLNTLTVISQEHTGVTNPSGMVYHNMHTGEVSDDVVEKNYTFQDVLGVFRQYNALPRDQILACQHGYAVTVSEELRRLCERMKIVGKVAKVMVANLNAELLEKVRPYEFAVVSNENTYQIDVVVKMKK